MPPPQQSQGSQPQAPNQTPQNQQPQQNTFHSAQQQQQQMTPNVQQQQPAVPAPGQQILTSVPVQSQFAGYGGADQHNPNAAPFMYPTHQRMNLPQQQQHQGNPQAPAAQSYPNYMYQQPAFSQFYQIDPMLAQQYITQGGGYAPQGYIYAQNPASVAMYNRKFLASNY
jgi:hypothetical protein